MATNVLITGGTGFVGSHIILELLQQTDYGIFCLVRPQNGDPGQRLFNVLQDIIKGGQYDPQLLQATRERCHVVAGDLAGDLAAVHQHIAQPIEQFLHCAASLNYEERFKAEIMAVNVEGTAKALELAEKLGVEHFNYVSTAYVAGKEAGVILEQQVKEVASNNAYEASKVLAEQLVSKAQGFNTRILRPSIVIGHSRTHNAFNFSGLYGFLRRLIQFKGMMERVQRGYLDREQIKMKVDPHVPLNLVPVDMVARQSVEIIRSGSPEQVFHITNPNVPTVAETLTAVFASAGVQPPLFVETEAEYNWIDEKFNEKIMFYSSYLCGHKKFDRQHADRALTDKQSNKQYAVNIGNLREYCDWYSLQFNQGRTLLPQSR